MRPVASVNLLLWLTAGALVTAPVNLTAADASPQIAAAVQRRIRSDAQAVLELSTNAPVPAEVRKQVAEQIARVEAELPNLPRHYDESFRAVLPLNELHAEVFRAQAALWRAAGAAPLTAWHSDTWAPLSPVHPAPPATNAAVQVWMMQNEYRAGAFNLSNAGQTDETLKLQLIGLPGGDNPSWVTVHEVEWTDTRSGIPVAAALPEAKREQGAFRIHLKSGLTRQVWLTFHPTHVRPGTYAARIVVSGPGTTLEAPLQVRLFPLRFPARPSLHLGGWDYTDNVGSFDITPENRPLVLAHLREHLVDSPWATAAVLPYGRFDAEGRFTTTPDTARFDQWLRLWPKAARYCVFMSVGNQCAGAPMGTPQFERQVGTWARFWARHARRRGLRPEQLFLLLVDEPAKPPQDAIILAWANAIHAAGTGIKVWEDPIHPDPAAANQQMLAACDVLCPNRTKFLAQPKVRAYFTEHQFPAAELAFYSCSGPARLLDPYAYYRLQAWSCWQLGARSSYFWAFSDAGHGSSWNDYPGPRQDYAPFFLDKSSLTPAKQMEAIRESAEDYEYLVMLRDRVAAAQKHGRQGPALDRARKLLAEAPTRVCEAKGASALSWAAPKDRTLADQVRLEILESLTALRGG